MSNAYLGTLNAITRELDHLEKAGAKIPQPIKAAQALYKRVKETAAALPTTDTLRKQLINTAADGETPTREDLNALATADLNHQIHAQAADICQLEIMEAIKAHQNDILTAARDTWHTPAVQALTSLSGRVTEGDSIESLLRARRTTDASDMALAQQQLTNIALAHRLRNLIVQQPARIINHWTNGDIKPPADNDLNGWLATIRAGHTPWLPTAAEAETAHAEYIKAWNEANPKSRSGRVGVLM